jgi:hypothetical protein
MRTMGMAAGMVYGSNFLQSNICVYRVESQSTFNFIRCSFNRELLLIQSHANQLLQTCTSRSPHTKFDFVCLILQYLNVAARACLSIEP